jgi:hypothetical protein
VQIINQDLQSTVRGTDRPRSYDGAPFDEPDSHLPVASVEDDGIKGRL